MFVITSFGTKKIWWANRKGIGSQSGGEGFKFSSYILPRFLRMYKWVAFVGCYVANIA